MTVITSIHNSSSCMHLQGEKLGGKEHSKGSFLKKILRLSFILISDVVAIKGEQYHNQKNYYIDTGMIICIKYQHQ